MHFTSLHAPPGRAAAGAAAAQVGDVVRAADARDPGRSKLAFPRVLVGCHVDRPLTVRRASGRDVGSVDELMRVAHLDDQHRQQRVATLALESNRTNMKGCIQRIPGVLCFYCTVKSTR